MQTPLSLCLSLDSYNPVEIPNYSLLFPFAYLSQLYARSFLQESTCEGCLPLCECECVVSRFLPCKTKSMFCIHQRNYWHTYHYVRASEQRSAQPHATLHRKRVEAGLFPQFSRSTGVKEACSSTIRIWEVGQICKQKPESHRIIHREACSLFFSFFLCFFGFLFFFLFSLLSFFAPPRQNKMGDDGGLNLMRPTVDGMRRSWQASSIARSLSIDKILLSVHSKGGKQG